jgi:phosphoribosylanthranilate isomerase
MAGQGGLIHVAGVIDFDEARLLIDCGVRELGLPLVLGYHTEDLSQAAAADIVMRLGNRANFFLITYLDTARAIAALCRRLGVTTVQLHGEVSVSELHKLREDWPELYVIKSLIVRGSNLDALQDEMECFAVAVNAFITDTFDPGTGAIGATGKTHDWTVSAQLVAKSSRPVILAGGLNADNVREAITQVRPAGVDVHTGVEGPDGRKLRRRVERFVAEAQVAFQTSRDGLKLPGDSTS